MELKLKNGNYIKTFDTEVESTKGHRAEMKPYDDWRDDDKELQVIDNRCNDCDFLILKNTKDRPLFCSKCELNYHWRNFKSELKILDTIEGSLKWIMNVITNLLKKF